MAFGAWKAALRSTSALLRRTGSGTAPLENQELRQLPVFKKNISLRRGGLSVRGKVKNKRISHPTSIT